VVLVVVTVDRKQTKTHELLWNMTFVRYPLCRCYQIWIPTSYRKIAAGAPFVWTPFCRGLFARRFRAGTAFTHSVWTSGCEVLGPALFANIESMDKK
jgi:hypothetical protein